jgi:hypothetical protein
MDLWLSLFWGSPIGLGVFFAGLGVLIWAATYAREHGRKQ